MGASMKTEARAVSRWSAPAGILAALLAGCGGSSKPPELAGSPEPSATPAPMAPSPTPSSPPVDTIRSLQPHPIVAPQAVCGGGKKLRVKFYQTGQALSALVSLPDGRHILVDTGESPVRPGCESEVCAAAHARLLETLDQDLGKDPIDMLWITHPHSDHIGGAVAVVEKFEVLRYVDNGRDLTEAQIKEARKAVTAKSIPVTVVEPGAVKVPLAASDDVTLTAIVPPAWSSTCKKNRNECSILLRVDYCKSSILFVGDAEEGEEATLDVEPVTLLQVGHHGSDTSSSAHLLEQAQPKYGVISSGKRDEGMNRTYCHPRALTVETLTGLFGGAGAKTITAFDARGADGAEVKCKKGDKKHWVDTPASDNLWSTARDGDIVLETAGDGVFKEAGDD